MHLCIFCHVDPQYVHLLQRKPYSSPKVAISLFALNLRKKTHPLLHLQVSLKSVPCSVQF